MSTYFVPGTTLGTEETDNIPDPINILMGRDQQ